jgi:hypothetical protein
MNQTGVRDTGSRRQASRNGELRSTEVDTGRSSHQWRHSPHSTGAPPTRVGVAALRLPAVSDLPAVFEHAVAGLRGTRQRPEILLEEIAAPQRLAPHAFAMSATVLRDGEEAATGRLVLLYDPEGQAAWRGTLRVVTYVSAELDAEMTGDPMLPAVGWSWLMDALESQGARYTAAGGTVTQTMSTRFGELADEREGPVETADVELRASWTPLDPDGGAHSVVDLGPHLDAWCTLLSSSAGLPPPGVTLLAAPVR